MHDVYQELECVSVASGCQAICQHPVNETIRGGATVIVLHVLGVKSYHIILHITFSLGNVSSIWLSVWSLQICWRN